MSVTVFVTIFSLTELSTFGTAFLDSFTFTESNSEESFKQLINFTLIIVV